MGSFICLSVSLPVLFIWGRVVLGLISGLIREFAATGAVAEGAVSSRFAALAALPVEAVRAEAEAALAGGALQVVEGTGQPPRWASLFHPELQSLFSRYERITASGHGALGGSAAGAPAFLEGHHILGPANMAGDRWWVARPGAERIQLSEESALGARILGELPSVWHVIVWQARMGSSPAA